MLTSLVRLVLSQSITTTTTTAYELEGGGAGVYGSILIDSTIPCSSHADGRCCEWLYAAQAA